MQDRIEEVLFWRKPIWTYAYMLAWGFICMPYSHVVLMKADKQHSTQDFYSFYQA